MAMEDEFGLTLDNSRVPWRHTFEDSDNEEDQTLDVTNLFSIDRDKMDSLKCDTLVICIGSAACDFATSHVVLQANVSPLDHISTERPLDVVAGRIQRENDDCEIGTKRVNISDIYMLPKAALVIQNENLKLGCEMEWARFVLDAVKPKRIMVLTATPHLTFSSTARPSPPFLRCLMTSSWEGKSPSGCPPLETSNFITGETAALLSWCQYRGLKAACIVCYYSQSEYLESVKALASISIVQETFDLVKDKFPADSEILRTVSLSSRNTNSPTYLYT